MHIACRFSQYFAAKKLIQLGTPINIVRKNEYKNGQKEINYDATPLETALEAGCAKIAAMLIRLGGIFRIERMNAKCQTTLEEAKKRYQSGNEYLEESQEILERDRFVLLIFEIGF